VTGEMSSLLSKKRSADCALAEAPRVYADVVVRDTDGAEISAKVRSNTVRGRY